MRPTTRLSEPALGLLHGPSPRPSERQLPRRADSVEKIDNAQAALVISVDGSFLKGSGLRWRDPCGFSFSYAKYQSGGSIPRCWYRLKALLAVVLRWFES